MALFCLFSVSREFCEGRSVFDTRFFAFPQFRIFLHLVRANEWSASKVFLNVFLGFRLDKKKSLPIAGLTPTTQTE